MSQKDDDKRKPGPRPEMIRIEEGEPDWKDALKHAMGKPKPKEQGEGESDPNKGENQK